MARRENEARCFFMRATKKPSSHQPQETARQRDARFAAQYGVSDRQIRTWLREKAPLDDPRSMDAWLASRLKQPAGNSSDYSHLADLADAKLEKLRLECRRIAFNNDQQAGLFVLKEEVGSRVSSLLADVQSTLRRVCERELPPILEGLPAAESSARRHRRLTVNLPGSAPRRSG